MTSPSNPSYPSWSRAARRAAAKQRYWGKVRPTLDIKYCAVCGEVLRTGGKGWQFGFHRKCDPKQYAKLIYESRKPQS